jgi:hypothetical protein
LIDIYTAKITIREGFKTKAVKEKKALSEPLFRFCFFENLSQADDFLTMSE